MKMLAMGSSGTKGTLKFNCSSEIGCIVKDTRLMNIIVGMNTNGNIQTGFRDPVIGSVALPCSSPKAITPAKEIANLDASRDIDLAT